MFLLKSDIFDYSLDANNIKVALQSLKNHTIHILFLRIPSYVHHKSE